MQKYTLAFIFNSSLEKVLLMHRSKPEWQKGKLNGIGGKVEEGETTLQCVVREIEEEVNIQTTEDTWHFVATLHSSEWTADVFAYVYDGEISSVKSYEVDPVEWFFVKKLPENVILNLTWLIPLSLDKIRNNEFNKVDVEYQ